MSGRSREEDFTELIPSVMSADAYFTDLSRGQRPGEGEEDALADLMLGLREEVEGQMPATPSLAELGLSEPEEETGGSDNVVPLRRRGVGRSIAGGLIGAAAATLVIAGGGAAVYNAEPGSPLWGMSKQMFGERAAAVELAGTLDELDSFAQSGDVEGMRTLLNDARARLATGEEARATTPGTLTTTATVELEPRATAPAPAPAEAEAVEPETLVETTTVTEQETVTETAVRTATQTVTVVPQVPVQPAPTGTPTPTVTSSPTAAPDPGPAPTE